MKKILALLLALALLLGALPALADSLTPDDVIGTWSLYRMAIGKQVQNEKQLKNSGWSNVHQFNADGTGKRTIKDYTGSKDVTKLTWKIEGNKVLVTVKNGTYALKKSGSSLVALSESVDGETIKESFKKTSQATDKIPKQAFLSGGSYKLDNKKKTAVYTGMGFTKCTALKIPDTIKVQDKVYKVVGIAAKACAGKSLLTSLSVGKNVKEIGAGAFNGCSNMKKITLKGTALTKVGADAFTGVKDSVKVTCPKAKLTKYTRLLKKAGLPKTAEFKAK